MKMMARCEFLYLGTPLLPRFSNKHSFTFFFFFYITITHHIFPSPFYQPTWSCPIYFPFSPPLRIFFLAYRLSGPSLFLPFLRFPLSQPSFTSFSYLIPHIQVLSSFLTHLLSLLSFFLSIQLLLIIFFFSIIITIFCLVHKSSYYRLPSL